jgi:predicted phage terminase large subunit-like protein
VVQELLSTTSLPVRGVRPDRDKKTRALPLALRYEQGMVLHCRLPSWFEDELTGFPLSEHDDAVDAAVYAYQQLDSAVTQSGAGVVTRPIYVTDASGY